MSFDYQDTFQRIVAKANVLTDRYRILAESKRQADEQIEQLQSIIQKQKKEIETLQQQCEYLRISTTLAPSREQVEQTRAAIHDLVRDIDRCIADLNE